MKRFRVESRVEHETKSSLRGVQRIKGTGERITLAINMRRVDVIATIGMASVKARHIAMGIRDRVKDGTGGCG